MVGRKELKGSAGEVTSILTLGALPAARVVVAGLGSGPNSALKAVRRASGRVAKLLRKSGLLSAGFGVPGNEPVTAEEAARAVSEGILLAIYSFRLPTSALSDRSFSPRARHAFGPAGADLEPAIHLAEAMMAGTNLHARSRQRARPMSSIRRSLRDGQRPWPRRRTCRLKCSSRTELRPARYECAAGSGLQARRDASLGSSRCTTEAIQEGKAIRHWDWWGRALRSTPAVSR